MTVAPGTKRVGASSVSATVCSDQPSKLQPSNSVAVVGRVSASADWLETVPMTAPLATKVTVIGCFGAKRMRTVQSEFAWTVKKLPFCVTEAEPLTTS